MIKQETFTPTDDQLIKDIDEIRKNTSLSRSKMIDLLLHQAVKVRFKDRKRKNAKESNS
jgi:metal-responsive CopG/Arc/MetJ family transcriptional regulator